MPWEEDYSQAPKTAKMPWEEDYSEPQQQLTGMRAEKGELRGGRSYWDSHKSGDIRFSQLSPQDQQATVIEARARQQLPEGGGQAVTKGALMNWNDEIAGGIAAPIQSGLKALGVAKYGGSSIAENYQDNVALSRAAQKEYEQANPNTALAAEVLGGLATAPLAFSVRGAGVGANIAANAKTGGVVGAIAGFGEGEGLQDGAKHAAIGTALGAGIGGALGGAGAKVSQLWQNYRANPSERALRMVTDAANKEGVSEAQLFKRMSELGDDAVVADVLGKRGHSLMSAANTVSPDARQIIETTLGARAAAKAERVGGALEEATGYGGKGVQGLKDEIEERAQPAIRDAYAAVKDVNVTIPEHIAKSETFQKLDGELLKKSRDTWNGGGIATELPQGERSLSHMDLLKRELDNKAGMAFRAGDNLSGKEASLKAGDLRNLIDGADPQHSIARKLFADKKGRQEAVDIGAKSLNFKKDALAALEANPNKQELAHGFAAAFGDKLGGANATTAINSLYRPNAAEIVQKVLGERAGKFQNQINAERVFDNTASKVGGSRTAEKYYDAAALGAGGIYDYANGGHSLLSGGATGLGLAALRRGGKRLQDKRASQISPEIAEILMSGKPPTFAQLKDMTPTERVTYQILAQNSTRQLTEKRH